MAATTPHDPLAVYATDVFAGRIALVTGAGRGIGRATALAFARLGADLVLTGRQPDTLGPTVAEVEAMGRRTLSMAVDIRRTDDVEALLAATRERFGRLHFLVNNAGGQFPARPSAISDNGWRAVVDLNLNGTWNMCSRFVPLLLETGYGSVVNMVHTQSFDRGAPVFIHSGAARAGVVNLSRTMALYLAAKDITVNAIAPGAIATEGFHDEEVAKMDGDPDDTIATIIEDTPQHRLATADEVAASIVWLCSPAARFLTGQALVLDGGLVLGNWNTNTFPEMNW